MYISSVSQTREKQRTRARAEFARRMMLSEFKHHYANPDMRDFVDRPPSYRPMTARQAGLK